MKVKVCVKCNKEKNVKEFYKNKGTRDGLASYCKKCSSIASCAYTKAHPEKNRLKMLKYKLRHKYGITFKQYEQMREDQNNKCAICDSSNDGSGHALCVDHDHKTGKVRALLCGKCNRGLGMYNDSIELLKRSIEYLSIYTKD